MLLKLFRGHAPLLPGSDAYGQCYISTQIVRIAVDLTVSTQTGSRINRRLETLETLNKLLYCIGDVFG